MNFSNNSRAVCCVHFGFNNDDVQRNLERAKPEFVLLLRYEEWMPMTSVHTGQALELCKKAGVACESLTLSYIEPQKTWWNLREKIVSPAFKDKFVVVDIGTMPR